MPRLHGVRERRHQPFWDSLVRTTGNPSPIIQNNTKLFGNANIGNTALTNLQVAGQFASDQTYIMLALRCWLFFLCTNCRPTTKFCFAWLFFPSSRYAKPSP